MTPALNPDLPWFVWRSSIHNRLAWIVIIEKESYRYLHVEDKTEIDIISDIIEPWIDGKAEHFMSQNEKRLILSEMSL